MKLGKVFKKLKGVVKSPLFKTALNVGASFVPGGSIAMNVINRVQTMRKAAAPAMSVVGRLRSAKTSFKGRPGNPSYDNRLVGQVDASGLTGGVGYRHSYFIAQARRYRYGAPPRGVTGTRYAYRRARALRRPMPFKGGQHAYRSAMYR